MTVAAAAAWASFLTFFACLFCQPGLPVTEGTVLSVRGWGKGIPFSWLSKEQEKLEEKYFETKVQVPFYVEHFQFYNSCCFMFDFGVIQILRFK